MFLDSLKKNIFSEIGIILLGASIVVLLTISSYVLTQTTQNQNFESFQKIINKNLQYQYHLLTMSNSIRDRMLAIHDINASSDPFEVDDLSQDYFESAVDFMVSRENILGLGLPDKQLKRLEMLQEKLAEGRNRLNYVITLKEKNPEKIIDDQNIRLAREINIVILGQIQGLIDDQLTQAKTNLNKVEVSNKQSQKFIFIIHSVSFLISIFIIFYIIKLLNTRKQLLNTAIQDLEDHNNNLERTVETRSRELMSLQKEHSRVSAEIEINRDIQKFIVPPRKELKNISEIDISTYLEPAEEVGGDYLDILPFHNGQLICIGDVTDHGLKSGVIMLMVQSMIRHQSNAEETDLKKALNNINLSLYQNISRMMLDRHLSLSLVHHHQNSITITGQHETIIIVRTSGDIEQHSTDELGMYVGLLDDISEFIQQETIELNKGDIVMLHTDGITEAENREKQLYGFERLCNQAHKHHQLSSYDIIFNIIGDVNRFVGATPLHDDLALIVFKQN